MKVLLFFTLLFSLIFASSVSYKGHSVYRCNLKEDKLYQQLINWAQDNTVDIWASNAKMRQIDLNMSPYQQQLFQHRYNGFRCQIIIQDVQKSIDAEKLANANKASWFDEYHSYEDIEDWAKSLVTQYPSLLKLVNIGNSTQGRTMWALELNGNGAGQQDKTFYIQGGQHSREWIGIATVQYIIYSLVESYGKNPTITDIVNKLNWRFVLVVNPDGYTYSRTNDRLWRKNRRPPPSGSTCYGVDTNRNWPAYWNRGGSSTNPCSETYMGIGAASEVEVQNVIKYWKSLNNIVVSTDYHSYGQIYMTPYGWTTTRPADYQIQSELGKLYAESVRKIDQKTYSVGTAGSYGIGSGGFDDYGYFEGTIFSQTVELRDTGRYGFLLPADQIIPTGNENFNGVITQALFVLENSNKINSINKK